MRYMLGPMKEDMIAVVLEDGFECVKTRMIVFEDGGSSESRDWSSYTFVMWPRHYCNGKLV